MRIKFSNIELDESGMWDSIRPFERRGNGTDRPELVDADSRAVERMVNIVMAGEQEP